MLVCVLSLILRLIKHRSMPNTSAEIVAIDLQTNSTIYRHCTCVVMIVIVQILTSEGVVKHACIHPQLLTSSPLSLSQ